MLALTTDLRTDRLRRLRTRCAADGLDGVILARPQNVAYVSGFVGSAGFAVVTARDAHLVLDFRYVEQAASQAPHFTRVRARGPLPDAVAALVKDLGIRRVGVEEEFLPVGTFRRLADAAAPVEIVPVAGLDRLRWQKSPEEVAAIRRAAQVAADAFADVLPLIRPGAVEREIAVTLEERLRRRGSQRIPFDTIVASGPRSALPHGSADDRVIGPGEFVTVDFGAAVDGYHADCTRTLVTAPAGDRHREIYNVVLAAQQAALSGLRAGMTGKDADALARSVIEQAGYGEAFGHSLGHGVGLAVHEGPTLSPREEAVLPPGAVVTVEPGIYLSGWGGVRIEDVVVLTESGCEVLTPLSRDLIEVRP
ncbi:MAG: aminopeptidase P family protein [Armatimonadota bacterium]|nr:aminopeptidase P family protein [Armatimonadota bacterium]MDR7519438.1 aminopeptidase P family protein [Armatimonadota bacterium]MDR7549876.1 aminopeptidase P family protein [Armatimonadota bacterium]